MKDEMPRKARRVNWERYQHIFERANADYKVRAEGSVWYLYSQTALANIREFNSDAKIIVMLRRPDEMVYSMHSQAVSNFSEDILSFDDAWTVSMNGNKRSAYPELCDEPSKLFYDRIANYAEQLERVYSFFPLEQVHVVFYDDFKKNTAGSYAKVLQFLEIDPFEANFQRVNENSVVKNRVIGKFLTKPPKAVLQVTKLIRKITGIQDLRWRDALASLNTKSVKREKLNEDTRKQIISVYREDILRLQTLCGRDLSQWLE